MNTIVKNIVEAFDFNNVSRTSINKDTAKTAINALKKQRIKEAVKFIRKGKFPTDEDICEFIKNNIAVYRVEDKFELQSIIYNYCYLYGMRCNLNWLDVSGITDFYELFSNSRFNGDISEWDVSNVVNMDGTFQNSIFNQDISKWDVSNVESMRQMFFNSRFSQDISKWNVSKVKSMNKMFCNASFDQDINDWDVSNVEDMTMMFKGSFFNHDLSKWDTSNVKYMDRMFEWTHNFCQDISMWNVSNVIETDIVGISSISCPAEYFPKFNYY